MNETPMADQSTPAAKRPANRLAAETSPYLLQHAHNPVDWRPWGAEAFEEARTRDVPIFLSVGYSTCYWCHVMERESFEDARIGALLSERFVCIKLDREERPDVDDLYMTAVQALTGRGGWPMSVFLLPPGAAAARGRDDLGLLPFYAGTYFPPEPRHGMPSFEQVIRGVSDAWKQQRGQVLEQASHIAEAVAERLAHATAGADSPPLGEHTLNEATLTLLRIFDPANGGFGRAPKFPQPVFLEWLLDALESEPAADRRAAIRTAVRTTLDRMALGGMRDHLGGGFHRYSVDETWLVPHFEKMLYDNGQLLSLYARSAVALDDGFDAETARSIARYILREMTSDEGLFHSAQDAEVDGREGLNYLWTREQIDAALGADDARFAAEVFGVLHGPNFRDPHHPHEAPANVLFLSDRPERLAARRGMTPAAFTARLETVSAALLAARAVRKQPGLDDKALTAWNGLMIAGLADAGAVLDEPGWIDAAARAAEAVWTLMRSTDAILFRTRRAGRSHTPAFLEDYAMYARGLLALHRAALATRRTDAQRWLDRARVVVRQGMTLFGDAATGALYDTTPGQSDLFVRGRGVHDGALPSGQSVMLHNLLDIAERLPEDATADAAARLLASMRGPIAESAAGAINSVRALRRMIRGPLSVGEQGTLAALTRLGAIGDGLAAPPTPSVLSADEPVQVYASAERVGVARDRPSLLGLELRMAEGWHVTANTPYDDATPAADRIPGVIGLEVRLAPGSGGLRVSAAYEAGEPLLGVGEHGPALLVHRGAARVEITLERSDEPWTGRHLLLVTYQPCSETACLAPVTVELDVAIDPE